LIDIIAIYYDGDGMKVELEELIIDAYVNVAARDCVCVYVSLCVCTWVCMYVYLFKEISKREREAAGRRWTRQARDGDGDGGERVGRGRYTHT